MSIIDLIVSFFVTIPTDNFLGQLYVVLNGILQIVAAFMGDGGGVIGGLF